MQPNPDQNQPLLAQERNYRLIDIQAMYDNKCFIIGIIYIYLMSYSMYPKTPTNDEQTTGEDGLQQQSISYCITMVSSLFVTSAMIVEKKRELIDNANPLNATERLESGSDAGNSQPPDLCTTVKKNVFFILGVIFIPLTYAYNRVNDPTNDGAILGKLDPHNPAIWITVIGLMLWEKMNHVRHRDNLLRQSTSNNHEENANVQPATQLNN